jgi:hypothetical protein
MTAARGDAAAQRRARGEIKFLLDRRIELNALTSD